MASRSENGKRNTRTRYSMEFKLEALELLKENENNVRKTAKEIKVSANTLTLWSQHFGSVMDNSDKVAELSQRVADKAIANKVVILDEIKNAKQLILNRMETLIPVEKNLDRLQKTLKTLAEMDGTIKGTGGDDVTPKSQSLLLIEQLTQNFNSYEPKTPITIEGDPEE